MNLVIASCFRNSSPGYVKLYADRIFALIRETRGQFLVHLVSVWGDSQDNTRQNLLDILPSLGVSLTVVERNHGYPDMGSSEHPDRLRGFAFAANGAFEAIGHGADVVAYVESDLVWKPGALIAAAGLLGSGKDVIAVPVFCGEGHRQFYDIWGFRGLDGERFWPMPPHHKDLRTDGLTEISTAGSFLVMRGAVARACRCDDQALVGFCHDVRRRGYRVWTDWRIRVQHP